MRRAESKLDEKMLNACEVRICRDDAATMIDDKFSSMASLLQRVNAEKNVSTTMPFIFYYKTIVKLNTV